MWNSCIRGISALALTLLLIVSHATAADLEKIKERGTIEIAVYAKFSPYSANTVGRPEGVDVEIGRALAKELGFTPTFRVFLADESVEDDFRNQLWKGHYLGGGTADVMMHVPADSEFALRNDQVRIFAPYFEEEIVLARPLRLKDARTFDAFLENNIGVEQLTLSSYFLLTAFGGGMRENTLHFKSVGEAVVALNKGEVTAVLGPRGELEGALGKDTGKYHIGPMPMPGLRRTRWDLGLAVKSGHDDLAAALGQAMSKLLDDGSIAQIFNRAGLTYRSPSVTAVPSLGKQASFWMRGYTGPSCH